MDTGEFSTHKEIIVEALLEYMHKRQAGFNRSLCGITSPSAKKQAQEYRKASAAMKYVDGLMQREVESSEDKK